MSQVSGVKYRDSAAPTSITITNLIVCQKEYYSELICVGCTGDGGSYNIRVIPSRLSFWTLITTTWPSTEPSLPLAAEMP